MPLRSGAEANGWCGGVSVSPAELGSERETETPPRGELCLSPLEDLRMKREQSTIHILSANLGRLLGPYLPEPVVQPARDSLRGPEPA
jgi:hypothetical protein